MTDTEGLIYLTNPYLSKATEQRVTLIPPTIIFLLQSSVAFHFLLLLHYNKSQPKSK